MTHVLGLEVFSLVCIQLAVAFVARLALQVMAIGAVRVEKQAAKVEYSCHAEAALFPEKDLQKIAVLVCQTPVADVKVCSEEYWSTVVVLRMSLAEWATFDAVLVRRETRAAKFALVVADAVDLDGWHPNSPVAERQRDLICRHLKPEHHLLFEPAQALKNRQLCQPHVVE